MRTSLLTIAVIALSSAVPWMIPASAQRLARTFRVLNALRPDVFLAQHPEIFDYANKGAPG